MDLVGCWLIPINAAGWLVLKLVPQKFKFQGPKKSASIRLFAAVTEARLDFYTQFTPQNALYVFYKHLSRR